MKFKFIDDDSCTFCHNATETSFHLFIECNDIQTLLLLVRDLCQTILGKHIRSDLFFKYVLFGYSNQKAKIQCKLVNFVLNIYRFSVWNGRKWSKKNQSVCLRKIFKSFVEKRMEIEFYSYSRSDNLQTFFDIFGVGEALIFPTAEGFSLGFY